MHDEEPPAEHEERRPRAWLRSVAWYAGTAVAAFLLVWWQLDFSLQDLAMPWSLEADAAYYYTKSQELFEHHTIWRNPRLAAPGVSTQFDLPYNPAVQYELLHGLGRYLTHNAATALNLYYVLGFPAAALTALFVFRRLGIGFTAGTVCALLFAFQYYHFWRGIQHPMLSSYWLLPIVVLIALRVGDGSILRQILCLGACVLFGATYVYYAFFACWLLLIAGIARPIVGHSLKPFAMAVLMIAAIVGGGALCAIPTWSHRAEAGDNPAVGKRYLGEAEHYALKMAQMVLPHEEHPVPFFRKVARIYHEVNPSSPESKASSIGAVASLGFVLLLLAILFLANGPPTDAPRDLAMLAVLNIAALLLATTGGFSSIAAFVIPEIRGYNRMSIYMAFFGLLAVGMLLDAWQKRLGNPRWFLGLLAVLLALGLFDQMPRSSPDFEKVRLENEEMRGLVEKIEKALPKGAMVFQLPHQPFPEAGARFGMTDYEHLAGYFWSSKLRWSYGAVRGRPNEAWQRETAVLAPKEMIAELRERGFAGLWVNEAGFDDGGKKLALTLLDILGPPRWRVGKIAFWELEP